MKNLKALIIFTISALSFTVISASANDFACPKGTTQVLKCIQSPQKGDHELAVAAMDSGIICKKSNGKLLMILGLNGEESPASEGVKILKTAGATNYSLSEDGLTFVLARTSSAPKVNGRFTIYYPNNLQASRTLTCN